MSTRWLRLYDELVDDPKIILLPLDLFRSLMFLWCITSQNGGRLPPIEEIAVKLRESPRRAAKIVTDLKARGFIDETENGLIPHNWNGRQFKSDGASTDRVKRFRKRKDDGSGNDDETFHETASETKKKRPQSQRQNQIQRGESHQQPLSSEPRANATKSLISPEAHTIAEAIGQVAGFSKENWPPGWCGAAYTIQKFLNDGCPGDLVRDTAIAILKRKRDRPPETFGYFEKPIQAARSQLNRPLPTVVVSEGQIIEAPHAPRKRTVIDAQNDLIAKLNAIEGGPEVGEAEAGSGTSAPAIRLLPQGRGE